MEETSALSAQLVHEAGSPLAAVVANLGLARHALVRGKWAEIHEALDEAEKAAAELTRIVTELRQIGSGTGRHRRVTLDEILAAFDRPRRRRTVGATTGLAVVADAACLRDGFEKLGRSLPDALVVVEGVSGRGLVLSLDTSPEPLPGCLSELGVTARRAEKAWEISIPFRAI